MLVLLSPAKSLDLESPVPTLTSTQPRFLDEAEQLVAMIRTFSAADLAGLLRISDELAALNAGRFASWERPFTSDNARPALLTFAGDAYRGMAPLATFAPLDYEAAQDRLRILSGLYGLLRPLDLIQPYRLEMGTKLANPRGKNLYAWWEKELTNAISSDIAASPGEAVMVNLASTEYFKVINTTRLQIPIITPRFEDRSPRGEWKVISFWAKQARGSMAGWLIRNRVDSVDAICAYDEAGYRYVPGSPVAEPLFRRDLLDA